MKRKAKTSLSAGIENLFSPYLPRRRRRFLLIVASFLLLYVFLFVTTQAGGLFTRARISDYEVGKVAEKDLILDREISFIDQEATDLKIAARVQLVRPIFEVEEDITRRGLSLLRGFIEIVESTVAQRLPEETAILQIEAEYPGLFTSEQIKDILMVARSPFDLGLCEDLLRRILRFGLVRFPDQWNHGNEPIIDIWRWRNGNREHEEVPQSELYTTENLDERIKEDFADLGVSAGFIPIYAGIIKVFAAANTFYDPDQTARNRERARQEVSPVVVRLEPGEPIVRKGFIVTEEEIEKIQAVGNSSARFNLQGMLGIGFFMLALYLLTFWLLSSRYAGVRLKDSQLYFILAVASIYLITAVLISQMASLPAWLPVSVFLPTALVTMLLALLVSPRIAVNIGLVLSLSLLLINRSNPFELVFAFFSGVAAAIVVLGADKRFELVRSTFYLVLAHLGIAAVIGFLARLQFGQFLSLTGFAVMNSLFCSILNIGLLPFFEHILNIPTSFRLIELSDLNTPLFRRMLTLAPGTYSHSVSVANLAESAAREIGANSLLARVGAYYHDIGKIDQPEYFVENQPDNDNKHNELKPSLSAAVIKSHVKIGIEKARDLKLPEEVIEIVAQHHGSGLINYFYVEALKTDGGTKPEDFSYNGIPPTSREAAVVMLADTIEAATRTLANPTVAKLEKFIWKQIMAKFENHQLDNCDLTFKDLEKIKRTFVQILAGHFHTRIEYPEQREGKEAVQ
ncbi:HDIG domain-containing metalloprotein [Marispirochaeta sp.]|uniref:HD family phosphohydrolase n=1 Tax=Marispirochaeta sp. TaxID=2038653 RepID=UPI0029C905F9|nr:HDIG domain-containing metalloprotein [Marispirochaeta sp.]